MPTDNTNLFKACVKTIKIRDKALKDHNNIDNTPSTNIFKSQRRNEFITKSTQLVKQITNLRDFILQYRKAYLNFTPSFVNTDQMTDEERDNIDSNSQQIVVTCSNLIKELKAECKTAKFCEQVSESNEVIVDLIEAYLKMICKMIGELTCMRNKWKSDLQKIARCESNDPQRPILEKERKSDIAPLTEARTEKKLPKLQTSPYSNSETPYDESPLTEEEMQAFQLENDLLYNDLNALNDEVRAIQTKVVKIAELQEVFTEKVLEQNEDLERINYTLVGTSENIRDANQQIRQAIQNNAGLRIYILFFLLVMSFSLLFLDWYND